MTAKGSEWDVESKMMAGVFVGFFVVILAAIYVGTSDAPRKAQEDSWRRRAAIYAEEFQKRGLVAVPVPTEDK